MAAIQTAAKLQQGSDSAPRILASQIIPTLEVNPRLVKNAVMYHQTCTNATAATIYTTPDNQDVYLSAVTLSSISDVTATTTYAAIQFYVGGAQRRIIIPRISLTVQNQSMAVSFPNPIKVDRGTSITIIHSTNVANVTTAASVSLIIDETSNG